jgi:predicted Zn-dependent peptidase
MSRGTGQLVAWANVVTDKTGDALAAMLADLRKFADGGLTDEELDRTRSQARADLVGVYESVEGIAAHLAANASLDLGADYVAKASLARDEAPKTALDALAKLYAPEDGIVVVVGPRARVQPMIDKLGFPAPEMRDAEGAIILK